VRPVRPRRGRFAPSPTGPLHLGNLRTALLAWLFARQAGGAFVLRIEDLDSQRAIPGAADQIVEDLKWLGIDWDEGPDVGGPHAPYLQSARSSLYQDHLERLIAGDAVYPCYCSRKDIAEAASAPHETSASTGYPGTCREPAGRLRQQRRNPDRLPSYRFRVQRRRVVVQDEILGPRSYDLAGPRDDFVVWRSAGTAAYQLAVVVDDAAMRIDEVVRGADLLDSTPLQVMLYDAFGYPLPDFAHVPLWRDASGRRLAKREPSESIAEVRSMGGSAYELTGKLVASCALVKPGTKCTPRELVKRIGFEQLRSLRDVS
jgi:glutamyl-tRNA synthetase